MASSLAAAQDVGPRHRCGLIPCRTAGGSQLPIGRLKIDVDYPSYEGDVCLFMPVIDKSGSMGGQPFEQVKTALLHMLSQTLANRSVFTCIIPYDSQAEIIKVPRDGGAETERWQQVKSRIQNMRAGGGTSFCNAFAKIKEVLFGDTSGGKVRAQEFEPGTAEFEAQRQLGRRGLLVQGAPAFVKSVVIVFMTDGQDNTRGDRSQMAASLRDILSEWTKSVTVHTVGFSRGHDFQFLDLLRKVGRTEGTFRYADPADGADALCSKLSELTDAIVASTCLPLKVESSPFSLWSRCHGRVDQASERSIVMRDGHGSLKVFVNLDTDGQSLGNEAHELRLSVPTGTGDGDRLHSASVIQLTPSYDGMEDEVLMEWQDYLVNEIVQELSSLAAQSCDSSRRSLASNLHLGFLLQRVKALEVHTSGHCDEATLERLKLCSTQLAAMHAGSSINIARLADAELSKPAVVETTCVRSVLAPSRVAAWQPPAVSASGRGQIFRGRKGCTALHLAVLRGSLDHVKQCVDDCNEGFAVDDHGDTALAVAAAIGRCNAAQLLLLSPECRRLCLHAANSSGETPLMLAGLRGHWKMLELLLEAGAGSVSDQADAESLIQRAARCGFYNSAARLVAAGLGSVTLDILQGSVPPETLEWVMQRHAETDLRASANESCHGSERGRLYLRRATENGMLDLVRSLLQQGTRPVAAELGDLLLLCGSLPDVEKGVRIAEALLEAAATHDASLGPQVFTAAASGWTRLLQVLLRHAPADCDWQNQNGQTAMLMACQARHTDCLVALLNAGARSCLADHAGVSPLMASCSRNHCAAVGALLGAGASVLGSSSPDTSALIVCCRIGRPEILDMLLKHAARSESRAVVQDEMQRLCALHVAAEHDQSPCIKVLLKHSSDDAIYAHDSYSSSLSATALHVAALHGHCSSAAVLLEGGADLDARDAKGRTALHVAVQQRHVLMVRLLRSSGADTNAKDASGSVPASYCLHAEGDAAADLRAELLDPALELLLSAARKHDSQACDTLRFAGLPGYLPIRQCVDVHGGDHWTPLLEAVACGNLQFASALIRASADLHRSDSCGLSPLFWAQALHGKDAVAKLLEHQHKPAHSVVNVQCKDGTLHVSKTALEWMDVHFPRVAAAAVPWATLALTLRAQGLEVTAAAEVPAESCHGCFTENDSNALARLQAARQRDVRDAMILEMHIDDEHMECGFACINATDQHISDLVALMQLTPAPQVIGEELSDLHTAQVLTNACTRSITELLPTFANDSTVCPQGPHHMMQHVARARHAAIRKVVSGSHAEHAAEPLSLQQLFVLHLLTAEQAILERTNMALSGDASLEHIASFTAAVHDAVCALPVLDVLVTVYCQIHASFNSEVYTQGNCVSWPGFVVVTDDHSALASNSAMNKSRVSAESADPICLLCIKTRSFRRLPFGHEHAGVLLPRTPLRVVCVSSPQTEVQCTCIELEEWNASQ
eukprot:TRINITY_DN63485_c0_g1_i1.p1 TRINITY_DN63485_c0_g1~~TRINITY_DN63485_c0_g1_i1.p1  ORF type:complete len:1582 (-),score=251.39 TRINITY_DN63485_c0_g1_i1:49-4455(-)